MSRLLVVLLFFGVTSLAQAGVHRWVDDSGRVHFSDKAPASRSDDAGSHTRKPSDSRAQADRNQVDSRPVFPGLNGDEYLRLRKLLRARQFEILNKVLGELTHQVGRDISQEPRLAASYQAFDLGYEEMAHYFNDWVRTYPNMEYAYLARASFWTGLGWSAYAQAKQSRDPLETQQSKKYFYNALNDIDAAIGKNRQSGIAYGFLMDVAAATQERSQLRQHLDTALKMVPESLFIRTSYMRFLSPEWGGSAAAMNRFAQQAKSFEHLNRLLVFMPAYAKAFQADEKMRRYEFKQAHRLYTDALTYGHHYEFYGKRARADLKLKRYRDVLSDLSMATRFHSATIEAYLGQAEAYSGLGQYRNAAAELKEAKKLDRNNTRLLALRTTVIAALVKEAQGAVRTGSISRAMDFLDTALDLDARSALARYERGHIHYREQRYTDALDDATVAAQSDVSRIEYFQLLDDLLSRRRFWNELLAHWDRYLSENPNDRTALRARARVYQELDSRNGGRAPATSDSGAGDDQASSR